MKVDCLVGLGANLGDCRATLDAAVEQIAPIKGVDLLAASGWIGSPAVGGPCGQDSFLNGVVRLQTTLPAGELLGRLQFIENQHGRERGQRWAARTLDADLLLYGDHVLHTPELEVPHPRMTFRPFVMGPAVEVAADRRHPRLAATLMELDQRRRLGEDHVVLKGGSAEDREAVRTELRTLSSAFQIVGEGKAPGLPKLQVCLDAVAPPLPGTPALWLPVDQPDRWRAELAAAMACVGPAS